MRIGRKHVRIDRDDPCYDDGFNHGEMPRDTVATVTTARQFRCTKTDYLNTVCRRAAGKRQSSVEHFSVLSPEVGLVSIFISYNRRSSQ